MFHPGTQKLIDCWTTARVDSTAPSRRDIDPANFAKLLPQVFILGRHGPGLYPFRLAGGFLNSVHGGGLNGKNGLRLWSVADRPKIQAALESIRRVAEPVVITTELTAEGMPAASMEVLLAPMAGPDGEVDRYLGLYQPTAPLQRNNDEVVEAMVMHSIHWADPAVAASPALRLATLDGRRIA
ncbi:PAS domain-containing protein [Caulobacter segnis]|uniref:PAS domain-containing protein n=1 Tax=Caulobacter segnis TaxID=88688 RepID=UPI002410A9AE|nr:PAS domain-containing protein [Caulobacter segnis]MDG2522627.1 PAS domain-containing protein [Caulobacter segnis]